MNQNIENKEVDESFFNIVISLSQGALVGMGKISNPQTGSVEKNLNLAKVNIDILEMLKEKTKGNLSKKENEVLTDTLTNLQLTFADEIKKDSGKAEASKEEQEENKEEEQEPKQGKNENKE